ncbi:MAG: antibiotic biosynthesis monooxygenase [Nocardioides sp.]|nr:antibiotic biosynthesis monooxygenase [Nocardioides sp.]
MVIVTGHLLVDPAGRASYLEDCRRVVELARAAEGCLDFALGPDLLDDSRINILERWDSLGAVQAFRGSGPDEGQQDQIRGASVAEYDVKAVRQLS